MYPGTRSFAAGAALVATLLAPTFARAADIVDTAVAAGSFNTLVTAVKAAGLVKTLQVKTAAGLPVNVDGTFGVRVNDAHVIQPDIEASNGVIHVIDTVLLPP